MKLLQNILATVDFSESSEIVVENSIKLAEKFNSQITLMHVVAGDGVSPEMEKMIEESIKNRLNEFSAKIKSKNVELKDVIIERGVPFEKIIQEAQNNDYNVIVAGSGNKMEQETFKLGTTVEKLLRKNQIPVWVVQNESVNKIKRIVCPIDFSDASERALNNAVSLVRKFNAELHILNVFTPTYYFSKRFEVNNTEENKKLKAFQEKDFNDFLKKFDFAGIDYKSELKEGETHSEILKYIKEHAIDLLIMGTTGKTSLSRLLMGSVTEKVTRELPCNFITTKARDITDDYFESNLSSLESIIDSAKVSFAKKEYENALEKYFIALKQYPDNIPVLMGIIELYKILKNDSKVAYFKEYAQNVVKRIWGNEYLEKFDF